MIPKIDPIWNYSNPKLVQQKAYEIYGKNAQIFRSKTKTKKYAIHDPNGKLVNFGFIGMEDYTKHRDEKRRDSYLKRSAVSRVNGKRIHIHLTIYQSLFFGK